MRSSHETFFDHDSFAVVGHEARGNFPVLTYRGLKSRGKTVHAIDPSTETVEGDPAFPDLEHLPARVEAAILEVPKDETAAWVRSVADAGIRHVWIHMGRDTPEALALAKDRGLDVHSGTCAVMYVSEGFSVHAIHRAIRRITGKY